jgi:ribosomal protein S18 acetylase RimI-like enzyme
MDPRLPPPTDVTLTPVTEPGFPVLRELAGTIWRQHYAGIISDAQINSMLAGRFMLGHIEGRARELGCQSLWLQVNKQNHGAIGFYRSAGFEVVREAVFEIGDGFVMDDYVMAKRV